MLSHHQLLKEMHHTASWRHRHFQKVVGEEEKEESLPVDIPEKDIYMYRENAPRPCLHKRSPL